MQAEQYNAWYYSDKGRWMAQQESDALMQLLQPQPGQSLLDVGCGTGYFSQQFQHKGLQVTGLDISTDMLLFAKQHTRNIEYIQGNASQLPFADNSMDYCAAVTSLCFVPSAQQAIREMWRVARKSVILGVLNRHSLLYYQKRHRAGYRGARWDSLAQIRQWTQSLVPEAGLRYRSAIFFPAAGRLSRWLELQLCKNNTYGGFLAIVLDK